MVFIGGVLFLGVILFLAGYYLGYCHASKQLMDHLHSEALSDKIAAAVYLYYGDSGASQPDGGESHDIHDTRSDLAMAPDPHDADVLEGVDTKEIAFEPDKSDGDVLDEDIMKASSSSVSSTESLVLPVINTSLEDSVDDESEASSKLYEAHLIGFGSKKAAERYSSLLSRRGIKHSIRSRLHRKKRQVGAKEIVWYQIVTAPAPYHEASRLLERLKKIDNLSGVVLVESKEN